ncbi:RNA-binding protein [Variovorax terrae]|uniref:RNA-binding protein n=1 Tax=Variovorax terrae TaxID=2923278 RepID=A0A9X2AMS8_9BURK|nr:RNA-binding protein [Variovorax terrae]MCJ0763684.1 RNA-binding protein [Variovorax terrae]
MKPFALETRMLTLRGVFYPIGYLFVMLTNFEDAEKIDHDLRAGGYGEHDIMLLEPEAILGKIGSTIRHDDPNLLPSLGTEAATVREYEERALQGHYALMIHAPSDEETRRVMDVVHTVPFSYAQRYRRLVIEDIT